MSFLAKTKHWWYTGWSIGATRHLTTPVKLSHREGFLLKIIIAKIRNPSLGVLFFLLSNILLHPVGTLLRKEARITTFDHQTISNCICLSAWPPFGNNTHRLQFRDMFVFPSSHFLHQFLKRCFSAGQQTAVYLFSPVKQIQTPALRLDQIPEPLCWNSSLPSTHTHFFTLFCVHVRMHYYNPLCPPPTW